MGENPKRSKIESESKSESPERRDKRENNDDFGDGDEDLMDSEDSFGDGDEASDSLQDADGSISDAYTARFPFILKDVYLEARIDPQTRHQTISILKINPESGAVEQKDSHECIHTVVTVLSTDEFAYIQSDPDRKEAFLKRTVNLRARDRTARERGEVFEERGEEEGELFLNIDDQFFAFRSWVQGIAEAGLGAIKLQGDFDQLNEGSIPIFQFLWRNLSKFDSTLILRFLLLIEHECRFEREYHKPSIIANMELLSRILEAEFENIGQIRSIPFESFPPLSDEDSEALSNFILLIPKFGLDYCDVEAYLWEYILNGNLSIITKFLHTLQKDREKISYDRETLIRLFRKILDFVSDLYSIDYNKEVRTKDKDNASYVIDWLVMIAEVEPDFLFSIENIKKRIDINPWEYTINNTVILILASRLEFTEYPEFAKLFEDSDAETLEAIAGNSGAVKFPEYVNLFRNQWQEVRSAVAANHSAADFPEFKRLFNESSDMVLFSLALNEKAVNHPEYVKLFNDSHFNIRTAIALNKKAVIFPEFSKLFSDPSFRVRRAAILNPQAKHIPRPAGLFPDDWGGDLKQILLHPNIFSFQEYELLFTDVENSIRILIAADLEAPKSPFYVRLFTDQYSEVKRAVAANPNAANLTEYKELFKDSTYNILWEIALNPNAVIWAEYKELFKNPENGVRVQIARNPNAVKLEEYKKLLEDFDVDVRQIAEMNLKSARF